MAKGDGDMAMKDQTLVKTRIDLSNLRQSARGSQSKYAHDKLIATFDHVSWGTRNFKKEYIVWRTWWRIEGERLLRLSARKWLK